MVLLSVTAGMLRSVKLTQYGLLIQVENKRQVISLVSFIK